MISKMREVVDQDDDKLRADPRFQKAFGAHGNIKQVRKIVGRLGSQSVAVSEHGQNGKSSDGLDFTSGGYFSPNLGNIGFGSSFYSGTGKEDRAGTLIHEASHAVSGVTEVNSKNVANVGDIQLGTAYEAAVADKSKDMTLNADSYRVFAGLCHGELRRRAVEGGIGIYRRAAKDCKQRVADMNQQVKDTTVLKKDGTVDVKATLAKAKKSKTSLAKTNAERIAGGKKALGFGKKGQKSSRWVADPVTGEYKMVSGSSAASKSSAKGGEKGFTRAAAKSGKTVTRGGLLSSKGKKGVRVKNASAKKTALAKKSRIKASLAKNPLAKKSLAKKKAAFADKFPAKKGTSAKMAALAKSPPARAGLAKKSLAKKAALAKKSPAKKSTPAKKDTRTMQASSKSWPAKKTLAKKASTKKAAPSKKSAKKSALKKTALAKKATPAKQGNLKSQLPLTKTSN
ncbi:hypothetical protein HDU67_007461 [Dinochytrium kinnereticum]|nr:hypothetical protein HDU67_007461 [Dinochytrium kinnereticum]